MGNVSSTPDDGASLYLRDQNRLSISSVLVTSLRKRTSVNIVPNAYPATRVSASRPSGDSNGLVDFVLDPESLTSSTGPAFLLKLSDDDDLIFKFTFIIRRSQTPHLTASPSASTETTAPPDTQINGLTFVYASNPREVENLVTREFHADPNLHKNANVSLVGTYSTDGSFSVTFDWTWKWKPPKSLEDKGGGWRNSCSFVEYDQRAHRLITLASFSFFVTHSSHNASHPSSPVPPVLLSAPPKIRVASSQSLESRIATVPEHEEVLSPLTAPSHDLGIVGSPSASQAKEAIKVDVSCPRPNEDTSISDDGPVFRATMKSLEQKTSNMRTGMKRLIKKAEQAHAAQQEANNSLEAFIEVLKEISSTNANAVQPAIEHYFDKIAREILSYEYQNTLNLQKIVIEPLSKLYQIDIKQAESKKRDFEEESKDFYAYVGRYLGQRHDSVKAKQSDSKYQTKRKNFELKRFDYSSFMQDLSGGRKEQEILSHLTKYADAQARAFMRTSKKVEDLLPQLEALSTEVLEADKEYQYQRREREEKRRLLEKSNLPYNEPEPPATSAGPISTPGQANGNHSNSDSELGRADSTGSQLKPTRSTSLAASPGLEAGRSPGGASQTLGSPQQNTKFRGIRDLEERDPGLGTLVDKEGPNRKEGLLWALNRPGGHVDPRNLNKQGWHKFWIVLDGGKLSEYSNWKQRLDLHMEPIDLRLASVREARNAERRFCFEVITPHFKRVYQATSEEDMNSWIMAINNALQSAVEGRSFKDRPPATAPGDSSFNGMDFGSMLVGKSPSLSHAHHHHNHHNAGALPIRRTTVGARPATSRSGSFEERPDRLLQMLRESDQGNSWCADCGSNNKVEWVSLNLAIIVCIECSGIHRSLGTHISKIRSLTLDTTSFTQDIVELLLLVGNRVSNMVFEAKLDPSLKLQFNSTREQRLRFITAKYVDRAFVEPLSSTLSRFGTADETLLAAIKRNEIQQVIYALALRANPNVADKSRGTHAVFLALAAADPAQPSPTVSTNSTASVDRTIPFPVAELLIQNGAEIPEGKPPIPLGHAAQAYVELKRGRKAAIDAPGGGSGSLGIESYGGGGGGSSPSPNSSSATLSPGDKLQKEREARLQKRVSAGGRLAKSPIPER